ncbi:MAG TPA: carbon-nitrogen hydrolase family protein, partial [Rhizomicrobium sp.]
MRTFAIAGLQLELGRGDNVDRLCAEIRIVKKRFPWLDMVVLGELNPYGTALTNAEPAGGRVEQAFGRLARETGLWLIPGSYYERSDDKIFNTAPVIRPDGEVIARYRKIFPFLPYERGVAPGEGFVVFDVPGRGRIGVSICYDIWFP